jgi:formylglycine-generating enzyme required for sulfatase activity/tRNA A-37 threonylcarbamoyl transferase component Bud32
VSTPGGSSPRDIQDIIATRMAGEMQPEPPELMTRATEPDAPTRITEPAADPEATRPSTASGGSRTGSNPDAPTLVGGTAATSGTSMTTGTGRFTGSISRLGRTRTNSNLPRDTQALDLKLQMSRPSVLADLGKAGAGAIPPGIQKLIDEHGTEGRYAVDKPLAQGGMGAVLLIKDGDFQRPAAMKVMLSQYAKSPEALERFLAEAQVTAQLEHPNIVPIHDLGIMEDGTVFFTMKFIEGESLGAVAKRLKSDDPAVSGATRADWTDERILLTFLKVLDGMSYAHAKGVVHRDIKPDNIMLGGHGEVLVVDWGIAKVLGRDELGRTQDVVHLREDDAFSLTREGAAMGTLYYMPPEQARGERGTIDARSDVYALGATLFELLTLKRPVTGGSAADIIAKVVNGEVMQAKEARPDLPDDLAAIVMKSLAFQPERRYQRCSDFADDIRRFLAGQAVQARRRNIIERVGAWIQRNKQRVALGAGAAALVAVSSGGALWWVRHAEDLRASALIASARTAIDAKQWQQAYEDATAAGSRPEAYAIKEQAGAALALIAKEREDAARSEADRARAVRLTGEARNAAAALDWETARDKAKAALEASTSPEAQDLLAKAAAALASKERLELEAKAGARKAEGDAALANARGLAPLDPARAAFLTKAREAYATSAADGVAVTGVDAALAEVATLEERATQARDAAAKADAAAGEAAKRRTQADESIAAAETALAANDLDAAAEHIAAARKLEPADERANALREQTILRLRDREATRASEASRATARATAAAALARARQAAEVMYAAATELGKRQAEAARLEVELAAQPLERKSTLLAARNAAQAASTKIAEQWALAEGAARSAADALAGEPDHADAIAARALLIDLYRGRLADARSKGALPEIAAFTNLLRRLGVDVDAPETGTLAIAGASASITVRRLDEDANGRLVAVEPPMHELKPGTIATLPQGRYELRAGNDLACIVVRPGAESRLTWAPAKRPEIAGVNLRWVPATPGFWLAEDEVTMAQYAAFLADPGTLAQAKRSYADFMAHRSNDITLLPREGTTPDDVSWAPEDRGDGQLTSFGLRDGVELREPVRGISRLDAEAFCRWLSAKSGRTVRLPTSQERTFAATGGDDRRLHPWGPGFDLALATTALPAKDHPPAVGSSASDRGPFGHRDLAGSVREWVSDAGLAHPARIAGGAWTDDTRSVFRSDYVESIPPTAAYAAIGFRILVEP